MHYYYLIAGLPDLHPEMDVKSIDFNKIFDMIIRNLEAEDLDSYRYLLYPNDIRNLLSELFLEYFDLSPGPFATPSFIGKEAISEYRFAKKDYPDFMNDFLMDNEDRFQTMTMQQMEGLLTEKYYEEVNRLQHTFITEYLTFLQNIKAIVAAFNFNAYGFLSKPTFEDIDRLVGQIGPSRSPTTSVLKDYPYAEGLSETLSRGQPGEIERYIDRILWDFLDTRSMEFFSAEEVFAYSIKLMMTKRWSMMDSEGGLEQFKRIHLKIKNNVRSPKLPVI